ncbi:MAG: hypothetical protein WCT85_01420 [Parachlamydiales bacterium]
MKKKIVFFVLILVSSLFLIFSRQVLNFGIISFLDVFTKKAISSKITFKSIDIKKRKIVLRKVNLTSSDKFNVAAEELDIKFKLKFSKFKLLMILDCNEPKISLFKNKNILEDIHIKDSRFFSILFNVNDGKINLIENDKILKQIYFDFRSSSLVGKFNLFFDKELKDNISLDINANGVKKTFSANLEKVDSSNLNEIISFFDIKYLEKISGLLSGKAVFELQNLEVCNFFTNLECSNLIFTNPNTKLKFDFKYLKFEGSYPDFSQNNSLFFKNLKSNFLKSTKLRLNFDDLAIYTEKNTVFSNIKGAFSFNPSLGAKLFLNGNINDEKMHPFEIDSKAYISSAFSNWLDFDFKLDDKSIICLKAKEIESSYNLHLSCNELKYNFFNDIQDLLCGYYSKIKDFKFNDGNLSFSIDTRFDEKGLNKVFITDFELKNIVFEKSSFGGSVSKLEGKSSFDFSANNFWDTFFSDIKIDKASFSYNQKKIEDLNANIFITDGVFQSSNVVCLIEKSLTDAQIKGRVDEFNMLLQSKGMIKDTKDSFESYVSCQKKSDKYLFSGNIKISDGQDAAFGFDLNKLLIFNYKDFKNALEQGWIRAEKVIFNKWPKILSYNLNLDGIGNFAGFYKNNKLHFQLKGEGLRYANENIDLIIDKIGDVNEFLFENDKYIDGYLDGSSLSCEVPEVRGRCYLPKFDVAFELNDIKTSVVQNILTSKVKAVSEDVKLDGEVIFDFSKQKPLLKIDVKEFHSDIESFQRLLKHFEYEYKLSITGQIDGFGKVITYFDNPVDNYFNISFDISNASCKINQKSTFKNLSLKGRCSSDQMEFYNIYSDLALENKTYKINCPILRKTDNDLIFDLRLENNIFDLLRLKGKFLKENKGYKLCLDDVNSHFFNQKLNGLELVLNQDLKFDNFKFNSKTDSYILMSQMQFLLDLGFVPMDALDLSDLIKTKHLGSLDIKLSLNEKKELIFDASAKELVLFGMEFQNFLFKGKTEESNIEIQAFNFNDYESSFLLQLGKDQLQIKDCTLKKKDGLFLKMQGSFDPKLSTLNTKISEVEIDLKKMNSFLCNQIKVPQNSIDGCLKGSGNCSICIPKENNKFNISFDLDFEPSNLTTEKVRIYNNGTVNLKFSLDKGFSIQGLDLSFYSKEIDLSSLSCKITNLGYDFKRNRWLLKDSNLFIPNSFKNSIAKIDRFKDLLEYISFDDDIDFTCDIDISKDLSNFNISSKEANFNLFGKKRKFKDLLFIIKESKLFLKFDYFINKSFYTIENIIFLDKNLTAKTTVYDKIPFEYEPLSIKWQIDNKKIIVKEISGHFCGINFLMQEELDNLNSNKLFGSIKIDMTKMKKILPEDIQSSITSYSLGKGYEISGKLDIDFSKNNKFVFDGIFSGKDFELIGYQFKTMFSKISINDDLIKISDFKISDQAGILIVNEIDFTKKDDKWHLSIPVLKIKDLRPALMQKINQPLGEMTPFLIREMYLYDVQGEIGAKESFTGHGNLTFINSFKRGYSVFDFPADVLSRIVGIDQALLVPVRGKIDLKIKDAKLNLINLYDSFSESERSKFYLLDKSKKSHIDFNGNIFINIAMKQYVLFKFTESFVISIRGNLENPEYNLKKKRGFLN